MTRPTCCPNASSRARGLWDELCIVDTGSRDGTREIAVAAGAVVVDHPWNDDFAAARNAGLDVAQGDFIVYLDADERISPEAVAGLRATAADGGVGAATILMRNPLPDGNRRDTPLLRGFRRDPSIRFRHAIHEEIATVAWFPPRMKTFFANQQIDKAAARLDRNTGFKPGDLCGWDAI